MGLIYAANFENVNVSTVQDVLALVAGSGRGAIIHAIELSAAAASAAPVEIRLRLKRLTATASAGSGGSAPSMYPLQSRNSASPSSTVRANDTTQATTSGSTRNLKTWQWNIILPFQYLPPPEDRPDCQASEALILETVAAPAVMAISGYIVFEEGP